MAKDEWGALTALLQGAQAALEHQQEPELLSLASQLKQVSPAFWACCDQLLKHHVHGVAGEHLVCPVLHMLCC